MGEVVLTGIGLLTPLGVDADALPAALAAGRSGVGLHGDLVEGRRVPAARVVDVPVKEVVTSPQLRRMDRLGKMATVAAGLALRHAGLADGSPVPPERVAVGWATEYASLEHTWAFQERVRTRGPRLANPMSFPNLVQNAAAGYLSILFGLRGSSVTFCHHETCGLEALGWAARQLRRGRADVVLVGVSEELGDVLYRARSLIGVEAPPGEGAVALILERRESARSRGARVLATVAADSAAAAPIPSHWYPSPDPAPRVLPLALERAGQTAPDLVSDLGRSRHLADAVGMSAVLPLFHVAALATAGQFPSACVVDARGGAARAVVLTDPDGG